MVNRLYEALVILKTTGTEAELAKTVAQLEEPITRFGGRIENSSSWGRRRLMYRIGRQSEGHYHLVQFHLKPDQLSELKRLLQMNESIVRFMILSREQRQPAASASS